MEAGGGGKSTYQLDQSGKSTRLCSLRTQFLEFGNMAARAETFSVRLPDEVRKQIDQIARLSKRSRSYVINEAVESYVNNRAAYIRELDEAVASADQQAGYSGEAIFKWLDSWGTEHELPSPKPDVFPVE
jgi:predicted transcriptional regulator